MVAMVRAAAAMGAGRAVAAMGAGRPETVARAMARARPLQGSARRSGRPGSRAVVGKGWVGRAAR